MIAESTHKLVGNLFELDDLGAQDLKDFKRDALAAWRRFVSCVELLPPDQAAPLWQVALAEVAAMAHGHL